MATIEEQWQKAYIAKYGEPIEYIESWHEAYRIRESLSLAVKEHHLYYREGGNPELVAIFNNSSVLDVWKTLATIVNYKLKTNERLYNILIYTIKEYNSKISTFGGRRGLKSIEFPIKGEELGKIFSNNILQNILIVQTMSVYSKIN